MACRINGARRVRLARKMCVSRAPSGQSKHAACVRAAGDVAVFVVLQPGFLLAVPEWQFPALSACSGRFCIRYFSLSHLLCANLPPACWLHVHHILTSQPGRMAKQR